MNQKKTKPVLIESWRSFAKSWSQVGQPGRPSKNEVEAYRKACQIALSKKKESKVLIFGATPEIRNLLLDYKNAQVVLVDNMLDMILGMTELVKKTNKNEVWIKSDWLSVPLPENYFDLILADWTSCNLPFDKQKVYYQNAHKWLRKDGLYAERVIGFKKEEKPMTIEELDRYFCKKPINNKYINQFWECGIFYLDPPVGRPVEVNLFRNRIINYVKKNPKSISAKIFEQSKDVFPHDKIWFIPSEKDLDRELGKNFKIINKIYDPLFNMPNPYKKMGIIYYMTKK